MINYDAMNEDFTFVPHHMRGGFERWFEHGIPPGGFGMAVLSNDLKDAYGRADHINKNHIGSIVAWLCTGWIMGKPGGRGYLGGNGG